MSRIDAAEAYLEGFEPQGSHAAKQRAARQAVADAIRAGTLARGPCVVCGETDVQGHHEDYDKPLDVVWLCKFHHGVLHADRRTPVRLSLRQLREKRDLSLREVQKATGFNRGILSEIENGKRVPTPVHLLALSDLYGVPPEEWSLHIEYRIPREAAA